MSAHYVPLATQLTEPTASRTVESAALEFTTLKISVNTRVVDEIAARVAGDAGLQTQVNTVVTTANTKAAESAASAAAAVVSQNAAAGSATTASTQATNSTTSATNAATNATTAATQAGISTTQAGIATTQATNASASAATAVASIVSSDKWAYRIGTTAGTLAGQKEFVGLSLGGASVDVFYNGSKLFHPIDYTYTSTALTLLAAVVTNDVLEIYSFRYAPALIDGGGY